MKISTRGRYGMRLMLSLALHANDEIQTIKSISKEQHISEKYLEQIISPLNKAGLVRSFRGAQGGYTLAKAPEDITAGEILRVLEGSENQACPMFSQCACLTIWSDIKQAIDQVVDRYTLADLVKEYQEKNE